MKHEWKAFFRLGVTVFLLYLAIHYWKSAASLAALAVGAAFPLLLGCAIAYAVNILMELYERHWFPANDQPLVVKSRRPVCLLLALASLSGLLFLLVRMILPELAQSVGLLFREAAPRLEELLAALNESVDLSELFASSGMALADGTVDWKAAATSALNWLLSGLGGMFSLVGTLTSATFTLVISLIFSIYLLMGKERLQHQADLVLKTYLKPLWYTRVCSSLSTLNGCFRRFIVGQCTEAVVLGLLCMGGMLLFRFPYATMVGTLIGFTALIPVAGAYIGAGVGAFLIFTVSPVKALLFLLFIVVLQQLEGNLIYPKVVGSSIGLPGIWVLAAVTVGGGMLGVLGMLLAVPLAATFYQLLRQDVRRRNLPAIQDEPNEGNDQPSDE